MKKSVKLLILFICLITSSFIFSSHKLPHCEIPCGVYGDSLRVSLLKEHVKTIEKSMKEIKNLEMMAKPNHNQLIRWVINKEEHCKKIQDIATQYFMFQRVKEIVDINKEKKKMKLLSSLHKICIIAMKMKQQTEMKLTKECLKEITNFEHMYFHKH